MYYTVNTYLPTSQTCEQSPLGQKINITSRRTLTSGISSCLLSERTSRTSIIKDREEPWTPVCIYNHSLTSFDKWTKKDLETVKLTNCFIEVLAKISAWSLLTWQGPQKGIYSRFCTFPLKGFPRGNWFHIST